MKEDRFKATYRGEKVYSSHYRVNTLTFIKRNNADYLGELKFEEIKDESTN